MALIFQPEFYCPFPSAISPHAAAVHRATLSWARHFHLIRGETTLERFDRRRYGELMARAYPFASCEALQLISDWNTWLFLLDDQCDETGLGRDPVRLAEMHACMLAILRGRRPCDEADPQKVALYDLTTRLRERAGEAWLSRFVVEIEDYFTANIWEATNRQLGVIPALPAYLEMRRFTGAVYSYLELIKVAEALTLPPAVDDHPHVRQLAKLANNCICWSNDIISLEKEIRHGDIHSAVIILCNEQRCSLQDAVEQLGALHDREMRAFIALAARTPSFGPEVDPALQRYIAGMQHWMRANLDWSAATTRYRPAPGIPLHLSGPSVSTRWQETLLLDMSRTK